MQIGFVPVAFSPLLRARGGVRACVRAREIAGLAPARVLVAAVGWEDRSTSGGVVGEGSCQPRCGYVSISRLRR